MVSRFVNRIIRITKVIKRITRIIKMIRLMTRMMKRMTKRMMMMNLYREDEETDCNETPPLEHGLQSLRVDPSNENRIKRRTWSCPLWGGCAPGGRRWRR